MRFLSVAILLFSFALPSISVAQEGVYQVIVKKQEEKEQKRWTLSDWLAQKEKIRMMDYWLAMNSSDTPFEFSLGADFGDYTSTIDNGTTTEASERSTQYNISAFASIVGISGRAIENTDDYNGSELAFNVRLLGSSQQNTNITIEYGQYLRQDSVFSQTDEEFKTDYFGASLTLYLIKYFGIKGRYMQINPVTSGNDIEFSGSRSEIEAFIDYGIIRIYGQWYNEPVEYKQTGTTIDKQREGLQAGIKFFF